MRVGDPITFIPDSWIHREGAETALTKYARVRGRTIREAYKIIPKK